jgi:hypothetical protein
MPRVAQMQQRRRNRLPEGRRQVGGEVTGERADVDR